MEVVDAALQWFGIGVATANLRNCTGKHEDNQTINVRARGSVFSDGKTKKLTCLLNSGDKVVVIRYQEQTLVWEHNG